MRNVRSTCESMAQHTSPNSSRALGDADEYLAITVVLSEWCGRVYWDNFRIRRDRGEIPVGAPKSQRSVPNRNRAQLVVDVGWLDRWCQL
jgi:hypothetical protein